MNRIFVEKKQQFKSKANQLLVDINQNLGIKLNDIKIINVYDVKDLKLEHKSNLISSVLSEPNLDNVYEEINLENKNYFGIQLLPAQFDMRATNAKECFKLIYPGSDITITHFTLYILDEEMSQANVEAIKKYLINPVETKEKDLNEFGNKIINTKKEIQVIENFINWNLDELVQFYNDNNFAMSKDDLIHIQNYFKNTEKRNPTKTEIGMLDTYWSDHCRHTTFEAALENVTFEDSILKTEIENTLNETRDLMAQHMPNKPLSLMNLAKLNSKIQKNNGRYQDVEVSDEINACSIIRDVDIDGKNHKYLIQFKNETHNHPTEIEPFGGASTCLGGAIRDPLSGRAFIYQGARITGSGNPIEEISKTLEGKLPQKTISKQAALGFSSYGNEIGMSTTLINEFVHPGYKAKRLEAGAVVGAVPFNIVKREKPQPNDLIILIGGKTGRDGVGGATGSSKNQKSDSIINSVSEVQKGNPTEERKLQRLFSNPEFAPLIKKSNDFGAGGVSVAVGEIADSLEINLDTIPLKYHGLQGYDITLAESQERMAILIDPKDLDKVKELSYSENLLATHIATVTDNSRVVIKWEGKEIVNIAREFIDTNGASQTASAIIGAQKLYKKENSNITFEQQFINNLSDLNVASQKSIKQLFDSSIGATTVLAPYGGKTQKTPSQLSVQKVHTKGKGHTNTATLLSHGFNPYISSESPYLGAMYSVIESITKIIAAGGNLDEIRFSFQEFFPRPGENPHNWGMPLAAMLGATKTLRYFEHGAIGGKDSMSGTYKDLNVPPTLISFACTTQKASKIISSEFKNANENIYILKHNQLENQLPNLDQLKLNFEKLTNLIDSGVINATWSLDFGGLAGGLTKMAMGNALGYKVKTDLDVFAFDYGSVILTSKEEIKDDAFILLGKVTESDYQINDEIISSNKAIESWEKPYEELFKTNSGVDAKVYEVKSSKIQQRRFSPTELKDNPNVLIPIFIGTNCEYDLEKQFAKYGANVKQFVFKNISKEAIDESINELAKLINDTDVLVLAGGFSASDEPDGSAKYIVNILKNPKIKKAIEKLQARKALIVGICNGFQALIKSGLLPFGKIEERLDENSPSLVKNDSNLHVAKYIDTKISTNDSPWLYNFNIGDTHSIPVSHGEGKFYATQEVINKLIENNQIAFQYVDKDNNVAYDPINNPNGSVQGIEGIISPCGLIIGKMAHSERFEENIAKNIYGNKYQNIFENAVKYFRGEFK